MNGGTLRWKGSAKFKLNRNGILLREFDWPNFITDLGRDWAADRLTDMDQAVAGWIGVGDGSGQLPADTTLDNETGRVALGSGTPDQGTGAVMLFICNVPAGTATGTISEVGIFNNATTGTMINYLSGFAPIDKQSGDDLDIDITINVG